VLLAIATVCRAGQNKESWVEYKSRQLAAFLKFGHQTCYQNAYSNEPHRRTDFSCSRGYVRQMESHSADTAHSVDIYTYENIIYS